MPLMPQRSVFVSVLGWCFLLLSSCHRHPFVPNSESWCSKQRIPLQVDDTARIYAVLSV